jgi:hypothetical protein
VSTSLHRHLSVFFVHFYFFNMVFDFLKGVVLALALGDGVSSTPLSNGYEKRTSEQAAAGSKKRFLSAATTSKRL